MPFRDDQPRWTFMINPNWPGTVQPVLQETEATLRPRGWMPIVRESELLPFNPPRLIVDGAEDSA